MLKERVVFMLFRCAALAWMVAGSIHAQTLIDLRTQSKSVDFTTAITTKPIKTGTVLPAACGVGEAFFQTNAPAGSNLYLCTSQNSWSLQSGTGGISGLNISVNGSAQGTQPTLNLISGTGIIQTCSNNGGANRVDCTPSLDTAFAPSRSMDQAGTDHSIIATSANAGAAFVATGNPTLATYTQNQSLSFIAADHACAAGATLNVDSLGPIALKKVVGGAVVNISAGDCAQGVPILLRAFGSPVSALLLTPDGSPSTGWVSNVTSQSASQSTVTLAASPTAGAYRLNYYANQNGVCTSGSNSVSLSFNWTDGGNARALATGSLTLGSTQSTGGYLSGAVPIFIGSSNVTYTSTVAGTCTSGTSSYDVHVSLERMQ
jgi:hypothetical protein